MVKQGRVKRINYKYIVDELFISGEALIYIECRLVYGDFNEVCQYFRDHPEFKWYAFEKTVKVSQDIHFEGGQIHLR